MPSLIAEFFRRNVTINLDADEVPVENPAEKIEPAPKPHSIPKTTGVRPQRGQKYVELDWASVAKEIENYKKAIDSGMGGKHELDRLEELQIIWGRRWGRRY